MEKPKFARRPIALPAVLYLCGALNPVAAQSGITLSTDKFGGWLEDAVHRSELCTGFKDQAPGVAELLMEGQKQLVSQVAPDEVIANAMKSGRASNSPSALAYSIASEGLAALVANGGNKKLPSVESAKVLCFAILSGYDTYLRRQQNVRSTFEGLIVFSRRAFPPTIDLALKLER